MGASIYTCIYYTTKKDRFRGFSRFVSYALRSPTQARVHLVTTTTVRRPKWNGPRADPGTQRPLARKDAKSCSQPLLQGTCCEPGTARGPVVVARCTLLRVP